MDKKATATPPGVQELDESTFQPGFYSGATGNFTFVSLPKLGGVYGDGTVLNHSGVTGWKVGATTVTKQGDTSIVDGQWLATDGNVLVVGPP